MRRRCVERVYAVSQQTGNDSRVTAKSSEAAKRKQRQRKYLDVGHLLVDVSDYVKKSPNTPGRTLNPPT